LRTKTVLRQLYLSCPCIFSESSTYETYRTFSVQRSRSHRKQTKTWPFLVQHLIH
jgi:hypothetical protein